VTDKTYDQVMTAASAASLTDNQRMKQAAVNDIADYFAQHAPKLNDDPNALGDMTQDQVDQMDAAADNILKGIHVVYSSPLAAALDSTKILKDIEEGANNALKSATEGATKGLGSTALKIAAGLAALLVAYWFIEAKVKK
jgi:hypothetical protein